MTTPDTTKEINDGGQVFPCEQGHIPEGTWNQTFEYGMSVRQFYAANAHEAYGIIQEYFPTNVNMKDYVGDGGDITNFEREILAVARVRLAIADAMLAQEQAERDAVMLAREQAKRDKEQSKVAKLIIESQT